ncbi:MAG: non-heme iron oxygenase ferredoxin subunit [Actinomycetota bacterium]|nr:non-heme iron oxygenase ferredoxin subunit [Actinomycetota bacterium]
MNGRRDLVRPVLDGTNEAGNPNPVVDEALIPVAPVDDIPPGWVLRAKVGGREVAIANCDGEVHALDNSCTHAAGPLGDNRLHEGCKLECPWHNSIFDAQTGEVVRGPARKPLRTYRTLVKTGVVYVDVS